MPFIFSQPELQRLHNPIFNERGLQVFVLRLDQIHPYISGNKLFKLKYNIEEATVRQQNTILTFGGAFSNHILATAAIGKKFRLKTIGIIRGEEHTPLNPYLTFAKNCDMELHYIDRETYRNKESNYFIDSLRNQFGEFYLIPEGGANNYGVIGCIEIVNQLSIDFDYMVVACGTGATIAGISLSLKEHQEVIGVPVLMGGEFLNQKVKDMIQEINPNESTENYKLFYDYHFGGYAKSNVILRTFIHQFNEEYSIPIEPVYTGKSFFAMMDLIQKGYFKKGSTVVILHCGGLGVQ